MWTLLEALVMVGIILLSITEFFIPLIKGRPVFGSFRKVKPAPPESTNEDSLKGKIMDAKEKVEDIKAEIKKVQDEADENYKSAEQLKEDSDNLLK